MKKILTYVLFGVIFIIGFDFGRDKPFKRVAFLFKKQASEEIIAPQPRVIAKFIEGITPSIDMPVIEQKPLVVIIPSYNNEKWVEKNLKSVINQQYGNFRLIYIDDNSSDNTYKVVKNLIENSKLHAKSTLIHNSERKLAMYNLYQAIHSCEDNEIVVSLDGDDWLAHPNVLEKINQVYQNKDVWLTYGQNIVYPNYMEKQCLPFDKKRLKQVGYRYHKWVTPQLRTFYAGLFKRIDYKDLMLNDSFLQAGCDLGYMFPMLEMSGGRYRFINEILYVYNQDHSFNDHKIHQDLLISTWNYVKSLPPYEPLTSSPF